jgi:hypothetical protein
MHIPSIKRLPCCGSARRRLSHGRKRNRNSRWSGDLIRWLPRVSFLSHGFLCIGDTVIVQGTQWQRESQAQDFASDCAGLISDVENCFAESLRAERPDHYLLERVDDFALVLEGCQS